MPTGWALRRDWKSFKVAEKKHIKILVSGKVQGVFYRASTKSKALELGVTGWVRNLPDGKVCIEAEGSEDQLNEFVKWCATGPEWARVDGVHTETGSVTGYTDFSIER